MLSFKVADSRRRPWIYFMPSVAVIVALAAISVGEQFGLSAAAYSSPWMVAVWSVACLSAFYALYLFRVWHRFPVMMLHLSLMLILAGALITHFWADEGTVHLREGAMPEWNCIKGDCPEFDMDFQDFRIIAYPGTSTPMDYETVVLIGQRRFALRLNGTANFKGYKFIQHSFDSDSEGVVLKYTCDRTGRVISYVAYVLTLFSMLLCLFRRDSGFSNAMNHLRKAVIVLFLSVIGVSASAAEIPDSISFKLMRLMTVSDGRIAPVATLASDFASTIGGRNGDGGKLFCDFLFDFGNARRDKNIRVSDKNMRQILGIDGRYASYEDFMRAIASGNLDPDDPATVARYAADMSRFEAVNMLVSGELLRLFPIKNSMGNTDWYSPVGNIPETVNSDEWIFIRKSLGVLNEALLRRDYEGAARILDTIYKMQVKAVGMDMPVWKVRLEMLYSRAGGGMKLFILCIAAGLLLVILSVSGKQTGYLPFVVSVAAWLWLTVLVVVRWIISGHVPLSNGFETMQFMAWILLFAAILCRRRSLLAGMAVFSAGLALAVAAMTGSGRSIGAMMPVLSSPLLSIHVVLVMAAYSLFLMMAVNGVAGLAVRDKNLSLRLMWFGRAMIYPAEFLLIAGILVGAVWADVSWGQLWSWDPKETWALITMLIYSFGLHARSFRWVCESKYFHLFSLLAFLAVLFTYFGVNFCLGGMHSYA